MVFVNFRDIRLPVCFCSHGEEKHEGKLEKCIVPHCDCLRYKPFHEEVSDERFSVEQ